MKWLQKILAWWKQHDEVRKGLEKLQLSSPQLRQKALRELGIIVIKICYPLMETLDDDQEEIRQESIEILKKLFQTLPLGKLPHLLHDSNLGVRRGTVDILKSLTQLNAADVLSSALADESPEVRRDVIQAVAEGDNMSSMTATIIAMADDPDPEVRTEIARALQTLPSPKAVTICLSRLQVEEEPFVRGEIAKTLSVIGASSEIPPFLRALEHDPHWYVRMIAVTFLGKYPHPFTKTAIIKALLDGDPSVRTQATNVLDRHNWLPENETESVYYYLAKEDETSLMALEVPAIAPLWTIRRQNMHAHTQAQILLHRLYAAVEIVVFGENTQPNEITHRITLRNPDVSQLELPMSTLKRLEIYPGHHLQQIEYFLTYAVNVIGQKHLKKSVDVYVYSNNDDALHTNFQNALTNLCKHLYHTPC